MVGHSVELNGQPPEYHAAAAPDEELFPVRMSEALRAEWREAIDPYVVGLDGADEIMRRIRNRVFSTPEGTLALPFQLEIASVRGGNEAVVFAMRSGACPA